MIDLCQEFYLNDDEFLVSMVELLVTLGDLKGYSVGKSSWRVVSEGWGEGGGLRL